MDRIFYEDKTLNIEEIQKTIDSFSYSTDVPITIFDKNMTILGSSNDKNKICLCFDSYAKEKSICLDNLRFSAEVASRLGEPYIFTCSSGLVNIAIAILRNKEFRGVFIAGPIIMNSLESYMIKDLLSVHSVSPEVYSKIILFLRDLKIFESKQVNYLSYLLYSVVLSLYNEVEEYEKLSMKSKQQAKIGEAIYEYKKKAQPIIYPYDKEKILIEKVKAGDSKEAQEILKSILNEILLIEGGNIEVIKARVLELCTILSRASVEGGASLQKIFGLNFDFITSLSKIDNLQDLCSWTVKIIDNFIDNVFGSIYSGSSYIISQAVHHINSNYMNRLTLKKLADYLHINESYLSKLFKKEMNTSYSDYLNSIRIKRSKELLKNSNMSIIDIALYVGYDNQSYFTKVFKKVTDSTPKKYRDCNKK